VRKWTRVVKIKAACADEERFPTLRRFASGAAFWNWRALICESTIRSRCPLTLAELENEIAAASRGWSRGGADRDSFCVCQSMLNASRFVGEYFNGTSMFMTHQRC
jgi:hypothetical protein